MAEPRCAHCGSKRVQPLLDSVGCEVCGANTNYDGELVHGPTEQSQERVSGPGGSGALPPSAPQNPGQGEMTTTENVVSDDESPTEEDDASVGDLDDLSRDELYERAQEADIPGRSSMTKDELVEALRG